MREAHSINVTRTAETSVRTLMAACEDAGAFALLLTSGRGDSVTSDSVKGGNGAVDGGCAAPSMLWMRPPGWAGIMKPGVLFPMFMQEFTAEINSSCEVRKRRKGTSRTADI